MSFLVKVCNSQSLIHIVLSNCLSKRQMLSQIKTLVIFVEISIHICEQICQKPPHMHTMAKNGFYLLPWHYCQKLLSMLLLKIVFEVCQIFMSARVSTESHWLVCTGSHFAKGHYPTDDVVGHKFGHNIMLWHFKCNKTTF